MSQAKARNWRKYNKSLINRGNLELWISRDVIKKWRAPKTKKPGRPFLYSSDVILCALLIRFTFSLSLRSLEGFLQSLLSLMQLKLPVPSYTQICRRAKALNKQCKRLSNRRPACLLFDSTGFKVFGDGEWKAKKHGASKRRKWIKFHIAICPKTQEIILIQVDNRADSSVFVDMMKKAPKSVRQIIADGAYDHFACRKAASLHGATTLIPPPKNGILHEDDGSWMTERNNALRIIAGLGKDQMAKSLWGLLSGYSKRALVETAMSRFKRLFGGNIRSRVHENQCTEMMCKSLILNKFNNIKLQGSG